MGDQSFNRLCGSVVASFALSKALSSRSGWILFDMRAEFHPGLRRRSEWKQPSCNYNDSAHSSRHEIGPERGPDADSQCHLDEACHRARDLLLTKLRVHFDRSRDEQCCSGVSKFPAGWNMHLQRGLWWRCEQSTIPKRESFYYVYGNYIAASSGANRFVDSCR